MKGCAWAGLFLCLSLMACERTGQPADAAGASRSADSGASSAKAAPPPDDGSGPAMVLTVSVDGAPPQKAVVYHEGSHPIPLIFKADGGGQFSATTTFKLNPAADGRDFRTIELAATSGSVSVKIPLAITTYAAPAQISVALPALAPARCADASPAADELDDWTKRFTLDQIAYADCTASDNVNSPIGVDKLQHLLADLNRMTELNPYIFTANTESTGDAAEELGTLSICTKPGSDVCTPLRHEVATAQTSEYKLLLPVQAIEKKAATLSSDDLKYALTDLDIAAKAAVRCNTGDLAKICPPNHTPPEIYADTVGRFCAIAVLHKVDGLDNYGCKAPTSP